jgi:hypothetical protein
MIRVIRETHEADDRICDRLARAGGTNRFGEANFRVVWGGSRLSWIGGRWTDRDAHGNVIRETIEQRQEPKYAPVDRWHIERWLPPEAYGTPDEWAIRTVEIENGIRIPALGPYPSRGEYEHCFTLSSPDGGFMQLSLMACDWIVRAIQWARSQPRHAAQAAIRNRETRHERDWERLADDVMDDGAPAFQGQMFVAGSS